MLPVFREIQDKRMKSYGWLAGLLACGVAHAAPLTPESAGVVSTTLDNGLQVVVWPDHDIPNAVLHSWYRVGSRNERPGITGLAHFFEHMMFNGTSTRAQGDFDREMEGAGGSNNAFTSQDVTVYMDWFPSKALPLIFDLESDRMAHLAFVPKVVESERGVVYSERRLRVDNDNLGALDEQLMAMAFTAHPYGSPVVGWPSDIEGWQQADLEQFYKTYYAPNNTTLVVTGDVDPQQVFAMARKTMGSIAPSTLPRPISTMEPAQHGERRLVLKRPGQTPILLVGYHAPAAADPQRPAFDLLSTILTEGDSSRLHRLLVDDTGLAVSVSTWEEGDFNPGLMKIEVEIPADGDVSKVETALYAALDDVARNGVTAAELQKARKQNLARFWDQLATIQGKARMLGQYATFQGDWKALFKAPDRYATVTPDDIRKLAEQMFAADRRNVAILQPQHEEASE